MEFDLLLFMFAIVLAGRKLEGGRKEEEEAADDLGGGGGEKNKEALQ